MATQRRSRASTKECDRSEIRKKHVQADSQITNADLMTKLCENGEKVEKLSQTVEELRAAILILQNDNDALKKQVAESKQREDILRADLNIAQKRAKLADDRSDFLEQYSRNYNLRLYFVDEPDGESATQCEETVLRIFNEKMGLRHIKREHLDAVHRLGRNRNNGQPRGIIVRFVSRRERDEVISNRKKLRRSAGKSVMVVEDLTKRNYQLYCQAKSASITKQCWTNRGKVFIKTHSDRVMQITSMECLQDPRPRGGVSSVELPSTSKTVNVNKQNRQESLGSANGNASDCDSSDNETIEENSESEKPSDLW